MENLRQKLEYIHLYKIFDILEVDIIFTFGFIILLNRYYEIDFFSAIFIVLIISIIVHKIFRINTTINKYVSYVIPGF